MSTLRVSNIEAKADSSSPTIDEKIKVTSSQGRVLVQIDGKTAGITSIGINTTSTSFTIDGNQNVQFVGIITAANVNTTGVTTFTSGIRIGTGASISSPATNTLTFGTNNVEVARFDSSGNIGIGTTNPSATLHVSGTSLYTGTGPQTAGLLSIRDSSFNGYTGAAVTSNTCLLSILGGRDKTLRIDGGVYQSGVSTSSIHLSNSAVNNFNTTNTGFILQSVYDYGATNGYFTISSSTYTGSTYSYTERLRLDSSGRLGIGTNNPTSTVVIRSDNNGGVGAVLSLQNRGTTSGTLTGITFGVDNSDAVLGGPDVGNGAITVENSGTSSTGIMKFRVYDTADSEAIKICGNGSGDYRNGVAFARAGVSIDNAWGSFPSITVFNTDGYSNSANRGEFRIHGINSSYSSYPGTSGADFSINLRIDGTTFITSDARHKTNIVDNPYGLTEILQLQPRKFNRINSDGQIEESQGDILGFIAQEVKEIIPEAVNYYPEEDKPNEIGWCRAYSLSDGYLISTLVNAVKEQNEIINQLKARIETLESQINT